jgi:hypothetical protein
MEVLGDLYALSRLYENLGENGRATRAMKQFLSQKQKSGEPSIVGAHYFVAGSTPTLVRKA